LREKQAKGRLPAKKIAGEIMAMTGKSSLRRLAILQFPDTKSE
jgi:hypothetical protein